MAGLKDKRGFIDKERLDLSERQAVEYWKRPTIIPPGPDLRKKARAGVSRPKPLVALPLAWVEALEM
jgi:hypothetical protein